MKTPQTDDLARGNHVVPTEWAEQLERERDEAREKYDNLAAEHMLAINKICNERDEARKELDQTKDALGDALVALAFKNLQADQVKGERDEARGKIENLKLQLGLWEDGNIICEETLGEIRLLKEQIDRVLLERNEAHKIAERAIDDLAWFNETNAQRLRAELDKIKEGAR